MPKKSIERRNEPLTNDERRVLATLMNQLNGVLICTLAACEGRPNIPEALQGAVEAAARIAQEAQQML